MDHSGRMKAIFLKFMRGGLGRQRKWEERRHLTWRGSKRYHHGLGQKQNIQHDKIREGIKSKKACFSIQFQPTFCSSTENVSRYLHSRQLEGCAAVGFAKDGGALLPAYRVHCLDPESSPAWFYLLSAASPNVLMDSKSWFDLVKMK